jgi:hypothetical protein
MASMNNELVVTEDKIKVKLRGWRKVIYWLYIGVVLSILASLIWHILNSYDTDIFEFIEEVILDVLAFFFLSKLPVPSQLTINIQKNELKSAGSTKYKLSLSRIINLRVVSKDLEGFSVICDYRKGDKRIELVKRLDESDALLFMKWLEDTIHKTHD